MDPSDAKFVAVVVDSSMERSLAVHIGAPVLPVAVMRHADGDLKAPTEQETGSECRTVFKRITVFVPLISDALEGAASRTSKPAILISLYPMIDMLLKLIELLEGRSPVDLHRHVLEHFLGKVVSSRILAKLTQRTSLRRILDMNLTKSWELK